MIGFFRKIRKKFADENQFIKYSRYAIGEILLVVIGILIALQINNWNEERKNRMRSNTYLSDIHEDFIANKKQFLIVFNSFEKAYSIADSLISTFPITDEAWVGIKKEYNNAFIGRTFNPTNSSVEGLINSGNIELIENKYLKKVIISWMGKFEDYKEDELKFNRLKDIRRNFELGESEIRIGDGSNDNLSLDTKLKIEKLILRSREPLTLLLEGREGYHGSKDLMEAMDTIISLTKPYAD